MREESATPQPLNRPRLVAHRSESSTGVEPSPLGSLPAKSVVQLRANGQDGFPGRAATLADPDGLGNGFPAEPMIETGIQGRAGLANQDRSAKGSERVLWMETVADTKVSAASSIQPSPQPHPAGGAPFDTQAALTLSGLIHDARNLVTTLDLYCDLLDVPGVLTQSCRHYAGELRLIAGGSRRILEKLAATETPRAVYLFSAAPRAQVAEPTTPVLRFPTLAAISSEPDLDRSAAPRVLPSRRGSGISQLHDSVRGDDSVKGDQADADHRAGAFQRVSDTAESFASGARWRPFVSPQPITSLAEEVMANHNLLSALAGPGITVGLSIYESKRPIAISSDDLTRILVNLTKNAAEAMPQGGHIQIALEEFADRLTLTVADTGCGLPESSLEDIFTAGYTTHVDLQNADPGSTDWAAPHRGLGLAIVRSIVNAAGGSITAANRSDVDAQLLPCTDDEQSVISGAVFSLNFPLQG